MNAAMVSANTGSVNNTAQLNHRNSLSTPQAQPASAKVIDAQSAIIHSNHVTNSSVKSSSLKSSPIQTTVTSAFKASVDFKSNFSTDTDTHQNAPSSNSVSADPFNSYSLKSGPLNLTGVLNRSPTQTQAIDAVVAGPFVSTDTPARVSNGEVVNAQQPAVNIFNQPSDTSAAETNASAIETNNTARNTSVDKSAVIADPQASIRQDDTASRQVEQQVKDKQQQIEQAETKQNEQLAQRDTEVKIHEQAHAAVGGSLAQSPSYQYEKGPDGRRYAVDGEVNIDVSTVDGDAQATLTKMQKVYAAAMAPVQPSMADIRVAAQALQNMNEAKKELITNNSDSLPSTTTNNSITPNSQMLTHSSLNSDDSTSQYLPSAERYPQQNQSIEIYV
ncbi:hypothetical protein H5202_09385 [Shewanella sp. SG41-4]|uniref:putative metalloprotease CJM1_0395 family protein n=1 Tax=Shewanella sp. SG41-4 TaxID=2760976 RepID=UPI001600FE6E|nr:putative metalloprotease CJM1_0395 family protein [Shewanella sp. SG41-4]MBB1438883.1 hypothetical protein [Shewanella sp. SG41-4]